MTSTVFNCPLCTEFQAPSYQLLLPHIRLVHSNKPGFSITCGLDGCQRSFTSMKTFSNHVYGFHLFSRTPPTLSDIANRDSDDASDSSDSEVCFDISDTCNSGSCVTESLELQMAEFQKEIQCHAATWILKTKEGHKITNGNGWHR